MKIVMVVNRLHAGGSERIAINLATGLAERGHECWILALSKPSDPNDVRNGTLRELHSAGIRLIELNTTSMKRGCVIGAGRLVRLCRSIRPDIVHAHNELSDFAMSVASRFVRFNPVRTLHNDHLWVNHGFAGQITESALTDDLVVCYSRVTQRAYVDVRRRYDLPESKNQIFIANGMPVDEKTVRFDRESVARMVAFMPGKVQLCFAGRFEDQKGFDVLLAALEKLSAGVLESLELHAFGQGSRLNEYKTRVERRGLPVSFHGPVHQVSRMFSGFDAVVMPSRYESLGLVALEALAAGVPLIATNAPGLDEVLPQDWPLLVPPGDSAALADALAKFARDPAITSELIRRVREHEGGPSGFHRMVDMYETAYQKFLASQDMSSTESSVGR